MTSLWVWSIPWDLEGENCSTNVDTELALLEHEETYEDVMECGWAVGTHQ